MNKIGSQIKTEAELYKEAEAQTNIDNLKYMLILAGLLVFCDILNEIGIFKIVPAVMRMGAGCGILFFLIPSLILGHSVGLFKKNRVGCVSRDWHKYVILVCAWIGTAATCIMFTHHTIIVMAIPIILMAQYRDTKKLMPLTMILATACVLLGVYGGYFWGCFDANLTHIEITDENAVNLALRAELATTKRMIDLLTHYALPRELVILVLVYLATKISKRNDDMLRKQANLQNTIEQEMQRTDDIQRQIISGMANLIENRDSSTGEHVKRTSFYVKSIIVKLRDGSLYKDELSDDKAYRIVRAAPLHDIGKIVVADSILQKPGKLTPDEYEQIKHHASEGSMVIKNVLGNVEDADFLALAAEIAGGHHERWDGQGYPNGIKGKDIPLSARIMAVADVFDALVSKRVYKAPMSPDKAFTLIESESGKQFDPEVVKAFLGLRSEIERYLSASGDK